MGRQVLAALTRCSARGPMVVVIDDANRADVAAGGAATAAAQRLSAARDRFVGLRARPYAQRCEQELAASGLAPAKRREFDPSRLTAQELAVARLVAAGMSNRQVASELFIGIKTVQFHLTHVYAKLGVSSRAELAATSATPNPCIDRDGSAAPATWPGPRCGYRVDQVKTVVKASLSSRAW